MHTTAISHRPALGRGLRESRMTAISQPLTLITVRRSNLPPAPPLAFNQVREFGARSGITACFHVFGEMRDCMVDLSPMAVQELNVRIQGNAEVSDAKRSLD